MANAFAGLNDILDLEFLEHQAKNVIRLWLNSNFDRFIFKPLSLRVWNVSLDLYLSLAEHQYVFRNIFGTCIGLYHTTHCLLKNFRHKF